MNKGIRYTKGFSCAPGSGFFARCPECARLLIFGQTCVCGVNSMTPNPQHGQAQYVPLWGRVAYYSAPRVACPLCQFEYTMDSGFCREC